MATAPLDPELRECLDCLCLASRRAARAITRAFDKKLRPAGIRSTQFSLLVLLAGLGPRTIGALADVLGIERTTLSRNLAVLEAQRWVTMRAGDEDARERIVAITGAGRTVVRRALPAWQEAQRAMTSALGTAGATALRDLSRKSI